MGGLDMVRKFLLLIKQKCAPRLRIEGSDFRRVADRTSGPPRRGLCAIRFE